MVEEDLIPPEKLILKPEYQNMSEEDRQKLIQRMQDWCDDMDRLSDKYDWDIK